MVLELFSFTLHLFYTFWDSFVKVWCKVTQQPDFHQKYTFFEKLTLEDISWWYIKETDVLFWDSISCIVTQSIFIAIAYVIAVFNPFLVNDPILCPLKTLENPWFFMFSEV